MTEKENAAQQTVWTAPRIVRLGAAQTAEKGYAPEEVTATLNGDLTSSAGLPS